MDDKVLQHTIALAKTNNQKAFASLFETHWDYVYGYLLKKLGNESLAEELTLNTLSKAFDKINLYNSNYSFKTWLISISKNIHIDYHRKEKTAAQLDTTSIEKKHYQDLFDENPSPEDLLITNQNLKQLVEKIKELKPHYAKVIRLRYFEELSYNEIADKTKQPINTIKVTLLRAKKYWHKKFKINL